MSDIERLLRSVLAERANDVEFDPGQVLGSPALPRRGGRGGSVRWGAVALAAAVAVTGVVVGVQGLSDGSGTAVPGLPPSSVPWVSASPLPPTGGRTTSPLPAFPPGRIPLTPGGATASPDRTGGCGTFPTAEPSSPEPPPANGSGTASPAAGSGTASPAAGSGTSPSSSVPGPSASGDGWPGDPYSWIPLSPPPAVIAVMSDLDRILDGVRFAGYSVDGTGRSLTVRVVSGPSATGAATLAQGCARAGAPVNIRYVARGRDVLTGIEDSLARSLPVSLAPLVRAVDPGGTVPLTGIDVERNRLVLYLSGTLTATMKRDLWRRYGDAVEVWLADTRTLAEPSPDWARG